MLQKLIFVIHLIKLNIRKDFTIMAIIFLNIYTYDYNIYIWFFLSVIFFENYYLSNSN